MAVSANRGKQNKINSSSRRHCIVMALLKETIAALQLAVCFFGLCCFYIDFPVFISFFCLPLMNVCLFKIQIIIWNAKISILKYSLQASGLPLYTFPGAEQVLYQHSLVL